MMTIEQYNKLRNALLYFSDSVFDPTKTKLLKLLYLSEEWSIKTRKFPLFGFDFYAWQFGPVHVDTWNSLNPDDKELPAKGIFTDIVRLKEEGNTSIVLPQVKFSDDYFSDNEMNILHFVQERYKSANAGDLVRLTHKDDALWTRTVNREPGLMEKFLKKEQTCSDLILDFSELLEDEDSRVQFHDDMQLLRFANSLNRTA